MREYINQSRLFLQYELGTVTTEQFYAEICRVSGFRGTPAEFGACFADIFVPIEPMIQLQATLRQRGLPAYIFSNTNELAAEHIRRTFPFYGNFDGYILSYQHGAMKPDARLYEVVERAVRTPRCRDPLPGRPPGERRGRRGARLAGYPA